MAEVIDLTQHLRKRAERVASRRAKRNACGRFEAARSATQLLEILKLIAEHAARTQRDKQGKLRFKHPWDVTQRAWQQAANELEPELGWIPKPNGIAEQLRRQTGRQWSWGMWLRRAFHIGDDEKFAESLTRRPERDSTLGDALRSMFFVTAKLGHAPVSKPDYDAGRRAILEEAAETDRLAYALEQVLDSEQVLALCGTWNAARALMGAPPLAPGDTNRRGVPLEDAGAYFYATKGFLPTSKQLHAFAKEEGFALDRRSYPRTSWAEGLNAIRKRIAERGLPAPAPYRAPAPSNWEPLPYEIELVPRSLGKADRENALKSAVAYLDWLAERNAALAPGSRRITVSDRTYREFSTGNTQVLSLNGLKQAVGPLKPFLIEAASETRIALPAELRPKIVQMRQ
jgi:hypothetical protein